MFLQHVTAPKEWQKTELTRVFAKLLSGLSFSALINGNPASVVLTSNSNDNKVQCYDHSHAFVNLPLTLKDTNTGVRQAAGSALNAGTSRSEAEAQHNEYKG